MKIYIATPVNGRREKTLEEKRKAAYERVKEIEAYLREHYPNAKDAEIVSGFDACPIGHLLMSEAEIMGDCVTMVMTSDLLVLDENWRDSIGCRVERDVAMRYSIRHITLPSIILKNELNKKQSV